MFFDYEISNLLPFNKLSTQINSFFKHVPIVQTLILHFFLKREREGIHL
jgi:hypothetical protein